MTRPMGDFPTVQQHQGLTRALDIVQAEIARAESLLNLEEGGKPVFDPALVEAGIAALRTVEEAIQRVRNAGQP